MKEKNAIASTKDALNAQSFPLEKVYVLNVIKLKDTLENMKIGKRRNMNAFKL